MDRGEKHSRSAKDAKLNQVQYDDHPRSCQKERTSCTDVGTKYLTQNVFSKDKPFVSLADVMTGGPASEPFQRSMYPERL